ncbi:MAG: penicillin-binding protein [Clostridiales bacterium]|nr:penicillin-binding protein [Clostridiales bacterium]
MLVGATVQKSKRLYIVIGIIVALFSVYLGRMVWVQIIKGEEYAEKAQSVIVRSVNVEAARGEILDCNGVPLVTNRQGSSIIFDASLFPGVDQQEKRNEIILSLINLLEANGETWIDNIPLVFDEKGNIQFKEDSEADVAYLKSKDILHLNDYATAQNCFDALIEKFKLQDYSAQDARKIASVCYELKREIFSISNPYTFAEDVSTQTVAKIKENSMFYLGVDVQIVPYREYADGTIAPHILGRVGALSSEEYEQLKDKGYSLDDSIGKDGIEKAFESYLRGTDGKKTVTTDKQGNVTSEYTVEPVQGDNIILTIDTKIQVAAQNALKEVCDELQASGKEFASGAAVVLDLKDSSILACASYPTFDISTYSENYTELSQDKMSPLWNRALLSTYAPGSTFKPAMAIAGLEEGVITPTSTFNCTKTYSRFPEFQCLEYNGEINVVGAIEHSCNIFFYETGYYLGINRMNQYTQKLGLGQKTGVELPEESGVIASIENRSAMGGEWNVGDTIQAAIGQSDNLVTPIQLANYCATIANGGTRYTPHFIKSIKSADYSITYKSPYPRTAYNTGFSQSTLSLVQKGMSLVPQYIGSATHSILGSYTPQVACKTGTAQIWRKLSNGSSELRVNCFLISYAPYGNPDIAMAITIEDAKTSYSTARVAKAIYDAYFANSSGTLSASQNTGTLLQ